MWRYIKLFYIKGNKLFHQVVEDVNRRFENSKGKEETYDVVEEKDASPDKKEDQLGLNISIKHQQQPSALNILEIIEEDEEDEEENKQEEVIQAKEDELPQDMFTNIRQI